MAIISASVLAQEADTTFDDSEGYAENVLSDTSDDD
jgi:hypothetical protein